MAKEKKQCEMCGKKFAEPGYSVHVRTQHEEYWKALQNTTLKDEVAPASPKEVAVAAAEIKTGDIYKHRSEPEHYCVIRIVDGEVTYCTTKEGRPSVYYDMPYFELKKKTRAMTEANCAGLVYQGKWIYVDNVKHLWERD